MLEVSLTARYHYAIVLIEEIADRGCWRVYILIGYQVREFEIGGAVESNRCEIRATFANARKTSTDPLLQPPLLR